MAIVDLMGVVVLDVVIERSKRVRRGKGGKGGLEREEKIASGEGVTAGGKKK